MKLAIKVTFEPLSIIASARLPLRSPSLQNPWQPGTASNFGCSVIQSRDRAGGQISIAHDVPLTLPMMNLSFCYKLMLLSYKT